MANTTYSVVLRESGLKAFIVPEGYQPSMEIHCWGAGGGTGWGGAPGGGGGYAKTIVNVDPGDEITLQIGQPGRNAPSATGAGGLGGVDPAYRFYRGGNGGQRGTWCGQNKGPYPSGGGGGASWVAVNASPVCVGAGGGGGGGYGHDNVKNPGRPGGVYPGIANPAIYAVSGYRNWGSFINAYGVWGGGQDYSVVLNFPTSGTYTFNFSVDNYGSISLDGTPVITRTGEFNYSSTYTATAVVSAGNHTIRVQGFNISGPAGVAAQILNPDTSELWNTRRLLFTSGLTTSSSGQDAVYGGGGGAGYLGGISGIAVGHTVTGGNGGLNYGDITMAGSGILSGGQSVEYYPGDSIGNAGNPGYIVIVLSKKLNISIKNPDASNTWVSVESLYYKLPTQTINLVTNPAPQTVSFTSVGSSSFTVPNNVTTLSIRASGGGGGGGGSDGGDTNHNLFGRGGSASNLQTLTLAVTPGDVINMSVGSGGGGAGPGYAAAGAGGTTTISRNGVTVLSVAGGAGGASRNSSAGPFPGEASTNGGSNGGNGSAAGYRSSGSNGQAGKVIISYTPNPENITTVIGGWKEIQDVFTKVNGLWKPILTNRIIPLNNAPVRRITANLSIVADTNDYNLFNSLPVTYYPGLMDITVWVYANVTIRGSDTLNAFLIDNFTTGDKIRVINYGRIQGKGGNGGAAGVYVAPSKFNSGTNSPGGAGGQGGGGIVSTIAITLENHGNIAGGGGGGGGGGVGFSNNWKSPSYIQGGRGGGGAGFGTGYNNGTLTSGGAGENVSDPAGDGGSGGARGQAGTRGANGTYNNGGPGGPAGPAIAVTDTVTYANVGTIIGPIWATVSGLL